VYQNTRLYLALESTLTKNQGGGAVTVNQSACRSLPTREVGAILICTAALFYAQNGRAQEPAPAKPVAESAAAVEQMQAGKTLFASQCSFCHGRDAAGGESGPDLTASAVVEQDVHGDKIGVVVRNGRPGKGMPAFGNIDDQQLAALAAFIHDRKANAKEGRRRTVDVADLQTGNAEAGMRYFNGVGGCAKCHSASGDLAGIASKFQGLELLKRMLYHESEPASESTAAANGRPAESTKGIPTVTVTLRSGKIVNGKLAYRDEFTIGLTDSSGWYRSWPIAQVKFTVMNPLEAHVELLGKYTDADIHNVLAYLETLR
jgi:cytochrome c oxidase cbb3-type subunit 3